MKRLITQSAIYKFSNNLLIEPGAFAAFKSFVFRLRANHNPEEHLTLEEAEIANEQLNVFLTAMNVLNVRGLIESITKNTQFNLQSNQFTSLASIVGQSQFGFDVKLLVPSVLINYPLHFLWDYLLKSSIDLNAKQQFEYYQIPTPVKIACGITYFIVAELLLAVFITRCVLAANTIKSTTPLHRTALADDVEKFRDLVKRGAKLNARTNDNRQLIDLLNPNSELISEFNLNGIEHIEEIAEPEMAAFVKQTMDSAYARMRSIASSLDYYLHYNSLQALNKRLFADKGAGTFIELHAAVKNNDLSALQGLFLKYSSEVSALTLQQQTRLFATANTIGMQAKLISMGVDFRGYMYKLHVDRQSLNDEAMSSRNNQLRIVVLSLLLPSIDTRISHKTFSDPNLEAQLEDEFSCAITRDLPSIPIKIGKHRYDLSALMSAWGVRKINPMTNLPCKVDEISFDLPAFKAINTIYPTTNPALDKETLKKLTAAIENKASLASYLSKQVLRILRNEQLYVAFDQIIGVPICLLINYVPIARQAISLVEAYQPLSQALIALYVANRIRRNMQDSLFNDSFLAEFLKSASIGIVCSGFLNHCTRNVKNYNGSMYQLISLRETNNLNIEFLEHNMHKFDIVFDPDAAWANPGFSFYDQYLDNQYIYLFACMLLAHSLNFAINFTSSNCFTDFDTYDFHAVEPAKVLNPQAKPLTFWKDVVESRGKEDSVVVAQDSARPRLNSIS